MAFREMRHRAGVRLCDAAEMLGVSEQAICHWETGKGNPTVDNLLKMADLYRCTTDQLLGREGA